MHKYLATELLLFINDFLQLSCKKLLKRAEACKATNPTLSSELTDACEALVQCGMTINDTTDAILK